MMSGIAPLNSRLSRDSAVGEARHGYDRAIIAVAKLVEGMSRFLGAFENHAA
jgi:hypothetical protein